MLNTQTVTSPPGRSSLLRSILGLLIINVAIPFGGTLLWTFAYLRRARQRVQTMQTPPVPTGAEALPESGTRPAMASR